MTAVTFWYTEDNRSGVNLNLVQTSVTNTSETNFYTQAKLGDRVQGNNGSEWIFVQASATVTAGNVVAIDAANQARNASQAMVSASLIYSYGVANFQPNQMGATVSIGNANGGVANAGDYFWACMRAANGMQINALTTLAQGASRIFIHPTVPGTITTTATNSYFLGLCAPLTALATTTVVTPTEVVMAGWFVPVSVTA